MRMKRWISMALAAVMLLAVAGIAIARKNGGPAQPTEKVEATFTATPVADRTKTRQCTGVDGTYVITKAVANGTATGDPRLSGNITIKSKTVVNTTTGLGWSDGRVFTRDPATGKQKGNAGYTAVITEGSKLEGFVLGKVKQAPASGKKLSSTLRANFSATVAPDGTISGGVGTGGGDNTAIVHGSPCGKKQQSSAQGNEGKDDERRHGGRRSNDGKNDGKRGGRGGDGKP